MKETPAKHVSALVHLEDLTVLLEVVPKIISQKGIQMLFYKTVQLLLESSHLIGHIVGFHSKSQTSETCHILV